MSGWNRDNWRRHNPNAYNNHHPTHYIISTTSGEPQNNDTHRFENSMIDPSKSPSTAAVTGGGSGTNPPPESNKNSKDFVRKLYAMLEEPEYQQVVRWTPKGDSFVVVDASEFTKLVLPKHFKHSNFASFVRQLNKYDFHKVRTAVQDSPQYGENAWEFKHPDFQLNKQDQLENIKRKAPAKRTLPNAQVSASSSNMGGPMQDERHYRQNTHQGLQSQRQSQHSAVGSDQIAMMSSELAKLKESQENVLYTVENLRQEHRFALRTIEYLRETLLTKESYLRETLNLLSMSNIAQAGQFHSLLDSMTNFEGENMPGDTNTSHALSTLGGGAADPTVVPGPSVHSPLSLPANMPATEPARALGNGSGTYRILLGEEDGLVARLCSKFITQYGNCDLDLVTDGLEIVRFTQANHDYDLVLLDSILSSLDGISVAELVHRANPNLPILVMAPKLENDTLADYMSRGISEVLIKPFSKNLLYQKLDIYLKGYDATEGSSESNKRSRLE